LSTAVGHLHFNDFKRFPIVYTTCVSRSVHSLSRLKHVGNPFGRFCSYGFDSLGTCRLRRRGIPSDQSIRSRPRSVSSLWQADTRNLTLSLWPFRHVSVADTTRVLSREPLRACVTVRGPILKSTITFQYRLARYACRILSRAPVIVRNRSGERKQVPEHEKKKKPMTIKV